MPPEMYEGVYVCSWSKQQVVPPFVVADVETAVLIHPANNLRTNQPNNMSQYRAKASSRRFQEEKRHGCDFRIDDVRSLRTEFLGISVSLRCFHVLKCVHTFLLQKNPQDSQHWDSNPRPSELKIQVSPTTKPTLFLLRRLFIRLSACLALR